MADDVMLEVHIDVVDEARLGEIESGLAAVNPQRWRSSRDIGTVITIASSAVGLINALLTLKDRIMTELHPPKIEVKNEDREAVDLASATREDLERLLLQRLTADAGAHDAGPA
jgi:hypothetical protein